MASATRVIYPSSVTERDDIAYINIDAPYEPWQLVGAASLAEALGPTGSPTSFARGVMYTSDFILAQMEAPRLDLRYDAPGIPSSATITARTFTIHARKYVDGIITPVDTIEYNGSGCQYRLRGWDKDDNHGTAGNLRNTSVTALSDTFAEITRNSWTNAAYLSIARLQSGFVMNTAFFWQYDLSITLHADCYKASLTIDYTYLAPGAFDLSSPANAAADISRSPTLEWERAEGVAAPESGQYRVLVTLAADTGYASPVIDQTVNVTEDNPTGNATYAASGLDYETEYRWKIIAVNGEDETDSTTERTFTTEAEPPAGGGGASRGRSRSRARASSPI